MDINDFKSVLEDIAKNPDSVHEDKSNLDQMLDEIVSIEKRHRYALDKSSVQSRRQDIRDYLAKKFSEIMEKENAIKKD